MKSDVEKVLRCSFCGRRQSDVKKLIAGPSIYICNECVEICNEILSGESDYTTPPVLGTGMKPDRDLTSEAPGSHIKTFSATDRFKTTSYEIPNTPSKEWIQSFFKKWKELTKGLPMKPEVRVDGNNVILTAAPSDDKDYQSVIEDCIHQANKSVVITNDIEDTEVNNYVN